LAENARDASGLLPDGAATVLTVAVDAPLAGTFDYLPAAGCPPAPGTRVRVPFGRGARVGVVVAHAGHSALPAERLKPVAAVLDASPLLDAAHLDFLAWAARYYHHPLGEVLGAALPVRLRRGEVASPLGEAGWALTPEGVAGDLASLSRSPKQRSLVELLRERGGRARARDLKALVGASGPQLRALVERGWLAACELAPEPTAGAPPADPGPALTTEQQAAVDRIAGRLEGFGAFLLEGVTGSGKTEVYLRLAREVLARGRGVLLLVPEIALTPQLVRRVTRRIGEGVAVLHSGLGEREREQAWQRIRLGLARLVVGTRSAVLGPIADLGLVVVDEEHDASYKQQEGFRYSARDLAVVRARRAAEGAGCPVVLGSATPSLEALHNVAAGRFVRLPLSRRAGGAALPAMHLLDIRDQPLEGGVSRYLLEALRRVLAAGEQALVFLNRRGFAPVLTCYECGWLSDCPRCDARQTLHRESNRMWCHHCGAQARVPERCPQCGSRELHPVGQGTQRVEAVLREALRDFPLLRVDRDAARRKGSLEQLLETARRGEAAVLVGTQMLAKGHHLPRLTLVGVLDADGGLFSADYRAAERIAQLVVQVAGRAGRGQAPGRVLIQTRFPDHPLLQTLVADGYDGFSRLALAERKAARLPPFTYQALLRAEATQAGRPDAFLAEAARLARAPGIELWGPAPAMMARKAGRYRAQLLLQSDRRAVLHAVLEQLLPQLRAAPSARRVRWSVDVDPLDFA
jgi:primosomal protein N' (replication factor Y)